MPAKKEDEFWDTAKDWSQRKHLIVGYYLTPAVAKLRTVSPDGRVVILDGFAGRGQYEDGTPGSPILTGRLADQCQSWNNPVDLRIFNIEANGGNFQFLESHTAPWIQKGVVRNLRGDFRQWLSFVLREAAQSPLFAFLDPFRPTDLPFADYAPLLTRRGVTELCFVFHTPAVHRIIQSVRPGAQTSERIRQPTRSTLDQLFGGRSWERLLLSPSLDPAAVVEYFKEILRSQAVNPPPYVVAHAIRAGYAAGLKYHIVFFTRNRHGLRLMNDAFCKETQAAYEQTDRAEQLSLALDVSMPAVEMPRARQMDVLAEELVDIGRSSPGRIWKRSDLVFESLSRRFGEFPEARHLQALKQLLGRSTPPRLAVASGTPARAVGSQTNDRTFLRFEL